MPHERKGAQSSAVAPRSEPASRPGAISRRQPFDWPSFASPFSMMRRFNDELDRMFGGFGGFGGRGEEFGWTPQLDVVHRGNEFIVRADLPGLEKDDIQIDVTDDAMTLRGERKHEHEEEREGVWRSERSYGSFTRVIPLPEGAISESAKANFKNGVLEITMQAPPREASRGRRLEITDASGKTPR